MSFLKKYRQEKKGVAPQKEDLALVKKQLREKLTSDHIFEMTRFPTYPQAANVFRDTEYGLMALDEIIDQFRSELVDRTIILFEDMIDRSFMSKGGESNLFL